MTDGGKGVAKNRIPITMAVLLATMMSALDGTIANVALPHIQGSVSASADQITWVLTSYIVASAIMTPLTGFLAERLGRKLLFLISISGFTAASMLCGIANGLAEIVIFRLLQGMFGAAVVPLGQSVLLDIYPPEKHGQAMAIWGAGAVVGPIFGPGLGGWLTDAFSWRSVFFINLPVGILAFVGVLVFLSEKPADQRTRLDILGFSSLAVLIGAFQLMIDRGPGQDWFGSTEIWVYLIVTIISLWVLCVQTVTARQPFIHKSLFLDANFLSATLLSLLLGVMVFSTLALLPPMMQNLMGYPVAYSGLVTMPRGVGSFITMTLVGQIIGRVNLKLILVAGLGASALSLWLMSQFSLNMDANLIIMSGILQGIGTGLLMVPLSIIAFATIDPARRTEAAGFFTLIRTIGASVGISITQARFVSGVETHHAAMVAQARPDNPLYQAYLRPPYGFDTQAGLAALNGMINRQAAMLSYVDDHKLMLTLLILCAPLVFLMRTPKKNPRP